MSTTEDREDLVVYELGYLLLPSISEDKLGTAVETLKKIVTSTGGNIFDGEDPFKIDLAYEMSKTVGASKYVANDAYIGWLKFEAEPKNVLAIDQAVKATDEVLRYLLVKAPRETDFTFAKLREAQMKLEKAEDTEPAVVDEAPVAKKMVEEPKEESVLE